MKINRFDQFVKNRLNEDVETIETPENFEKEEGLERTEKTEDIDNSNLVDNVDQDMNDDIENDNMEEPENFDSEENIPRKRTVKSYDDFSDDEDFSEEEDEFPGGEWSEESELRDPDEDYLFSGEGEEEEGEESGEYKGESEMKRLANLLGTDVVNNQIEFEGKKINYYSETEKFHVGKKKFKTPEEVIDYLEGGSEGSEKMRSPRNMGHEEELRRGDEMEMGSEEEDMPLRNMAMESRRFSRRRRF